MDPHTGARFGSDPAGESVVVRMAMGDDDVPDLIQRGAEAFKTLLQALPGLWSVGTGVDEGGLLSFDQIEIHRPDREGGRDLQGVDAAGHWTLPRTRKRSLA